MSQISRLHSTEIANGNLIDATHLNNEFNQLVSESNGQDTRLTTSESKITAMLGGLKSYVNGLSLKYSTSNRVIIKPGVCRDSSNADFIEVTSDITVDISTSGANGLDTGTEAANTWYYVWAIKNPSSSTVAGLFSTSDATPTLPSGYTLKRLIGAVRNDGSSNLLKFYTYGTNNDRDFMYDDLPVALSSGTATSFTAVSLASSVPTSTTSRKAWIYGYLYQSAVPAAGAQVLLEIRPAGSASADGRLQAFARVSTVGVVGDGNVTGLIDTDSSAQIEYRLTYVSDTTSTIKVSGFRMEI